MKPVRLSPENRCKKHILLLDPDPSVREALASVLRSENYCVVCASDEKEAFDQLVRHPIDVALVDLNGSEESNWQVVQRLGEADPDLRIILLTAHPDRMEHPLASRAQAWFQKPLLDLPLLFNKVTELTVGKSPTS